MNVHPVTPTRSLNCPDCRKAMGGLEFATEPPLEAEHCESCHGIFFDKGELEAVLQSEEGRSIWIDRPILEPAAQSSAVRDTDKEIFYRACPVCSEMMHRYNFGRRSGVIIDLCKNHGCWLDAGELKELVHWWKDGGKAIHARADQEEAVERKQVVNRRISPGHTPGPIEAKEELPRWAKVGLFIFGLLLESVD